MRGALHITDYSYENQLFRDIAEWLLKRFKNVKHTANFIMIFSHRIHIHLSHCHLTLYILYMDMYMHISLHCITQESVQSMSIFKFLWQVNGDKVIYRRYQAFFIYTTDSVDFPDSKVHGANMGPPGSCRPQVGPLLAPWTLLSGFFRKRYLGYWSDDHHPIYYMHPRRPSETQHPGKSRVLYKIIFCRCVLLIIQFSP